MGNIRGQRASVIYIDDPMDEDIKQQISQITQENKPLAVSIDTRPCDGEHCTGCICNRFCDIQDDIMEKKREED